MCNEKKKNIVDIFWKMQYNFKYIKNNLYKTKIKTNRGHTMSEELKYNEPWILQRADPYVYRHTDGNYYLQHPYRPMTGLC